MYKVKEKSDCIKRRQLFKTNLIENENTNLQLQLLRKDCLLLFMYDNIIRMMWMYDNNMTNTVSPIMNTIEYYRTLYVTITHSFISIVIMVHGKEVRLR